MSSTYKNRLIILGFILVCLFLFWFTGLYKWLSFENFKQNKEHFVVFVKENYILSVLTYCLIMTLLVVSALPIGGLLVLIAGFLFGVFWGAIYSIVAATFGCIISFLLFRYFFGNFIQKKYESRLEKFNKNIEEFGASYILAAHFIMMPFFIVNTFAALTKISLKKFVAATFIGIIPSNFIYAYAGRQLGKINSVKQVFSTNVLFAFLLLVMLGFLPVILKKYKITHKI